jgi:uncharacterized protein (TIGR03435 family)
MPLDLSVFDLDAEEFRAMMRYLLAERFHRIVHMEWKEFPGYEMVVAKAWPKLKLSRTSSEETPRPS